MRGLFGQAAVDQMCVSRLLEAAGVQLASGSASSVALDSLEAQRIDVDAFGGRARASVGTARNPLAEQRIDHDITIAFAADHVVSQQRAERRLYR